MSPSLKRRMYVQILIITAAIILANRNVAQLLLLGQLQASSWQEMSVALQECEHAAGQVETLQQCVQAPSSASVTMLLISDYLICPSRQSGGIGSPSCQALAARQGDWKISHPADGDARVDRMEVEAGDETWRGVRLASRPDGVQVWLSDASIKALRKKVWDLRDRNLAYTLPVILIMLGLLTLSLVYLILRPIRTFEKSISSMTSSNLGQRSNLVSPYREFDRMVEAFENLRARLDESFVKARRFAGDASHELRTPLTILRGNVEQMIIDLPVGSEHQVRMRMISDEVERLIDITEKLLLLSRADGNSMVKDEVLFPISDFLHELALDSQGFHPEIEMRCTIQPGLIWRCDQRLIQQLIYNLYSNAMKYNVQNGWIRMDLSSRGHELVLEFENPSESIPEQLSELAFERFYRGNAAHSRKIDGLGLGLSLCREIARLHEASLTLSVTTNSTVLVQLVMPTHSHEKA